MLTVFLSVLPAALTPDTDLGCGPDPIGMGDVGGWRLEDGARRPLLGVAGVDLKEADRPPVLFLVLLTGSAGSAIDGGPLEGRAGLGSAVDISTFCPPNSFLAGRMTDIGCVTTVVPQRQSPSASQLVR